MPRRMRQVDQEQSTELDMTPMLDVVFILLIFFIVTAVFVKLPGVEPTMPDAEQFDGELRPTIILAVTADDEIWYDRSLIPTERLNVEVKAIQAENPKADALIKADGDAPHGTVHKVMVALQTAGVKVQRVSIEPVVR